MSEQQRPAPGPDEPLDDGPRPADDVPADEAPAPVAEAVVTLAQPGSIGFRSGE